VALRIVLPRPAERRQGCSYDGSARRVPACFAGDNRLKEKFMNIATKPTAQAGTRHVPRVDGPSNLRNS
jgi:hypothetical protein